MSNEAMAYNVTEVKEHEIELRALSKKKMQERGVRHGETCFKLPHETPGHLHSAVDDGPFYVDGIWYCGRCHHVLDASDTYVLDTP